MGEEMNITLFLAKSSQISVNGIDKKELIIEPDPKEIWPIALGDIDVKDHIVEFDPSPLKKVGCVLSKPYIKEALLVDTPPITDFIIQQMMERSLYDVEIRQPIDAKDLPRKLKKAFQHGWRYSRDTKWRRKVANMVRRKKFVLHDASITLTENDDHSVTATIEAHGRKEAEQ